jgi:hypothetical protein
MYFFFYFDLLLSELLQSSIRASFISSDKRSPAGNTLPDRRIHVMWTAGGICGKGKRQ